jgi:hypothetical protein
VNNNVNNNVQVAGPKADSMVDNLEDSMEDAMDDQMDDNLDDNLDDEQGDRPMTSAFDSNFDPNDKMQASVLQSQQAQAMNSEEEEDLNLDEIDNILELGEELFPRFTLAKNKARFLRMVSWYRGKEEWIEVAPLSGVTKLFKQQTKELEGIRSSKLDYEMELETGTLTPSQRSYRRDELKMCKVQEKMAVHLISKLQVKIKSGRR